MSARSNQPEIDYLTRGPCTVSGTGRTHDLAISRLLTVPRQKGDPSCAVGMTLPVVRARLQGPHVQISPDSICHPFVATYIPATSVSACRRVTEPSYLAKKSIIKDQKPAIQMAFEEAIGWDTGICTRLVDVLRAAGIGEKDIDRAVALFSAAALELQTIAGPLVTAANLSWVEVPTEGGKSERVWVSAVGSELWAGYSNIAYCMAQNVAFTEAATKFGECLTWLSGIVMGTPAYAAALAAVVAQKCREPAAKKRKTDTAVVVVGESKKETLAAARQQCALLEAEIDAESAELEREREELLLQVEDGKTKEKESRTRRTAYRQQIQELKAQIQDLEAQLEAHIQESQPSHEAALAKKDAKHVKKVRQLVESLRDANQQIAGGVTAAELQADIVARQQATTNQRIADLEAEISRLHDENQRTQGLLETSNATIASMVAQPAPPPFVAIPFQPAPSQAGASPAATVAPSPMNYDFLNTGTPWNF